MENIIIIGSGGFGREVKEVIDEINAVQPTWNFLGFIDENKTGLTLEEDKILGTLLDLLNIKEPYKVVVAIADIKSRIKIVKFCEENNIQFATIIHPDFIKRGDLCTIGEGTIITSGCSIAINTHIGKHCILNTKSGLGHDTTIGNFVDLMPETLIMGDVHVGNNCYFGVRSTIINGLSITENCTFGACACVVKNVTEPGTYVGVPAKLIKPYNA